MRPWLVLLLGAASCSPYNYSKEITAFSTDVDQLSKAVSTGYDGVTSDRIAESQRALIESYERKSRFQVDIPASCQHLGGPKTDPSCALFPKGGSPSTPSELERTRGDVLAKIAVLTNYTKALAAITNSADRTAFDGAVAQLSTAVSGFAKYAPGIGAVAPAAINLFGWLVGTALDEQRFETLKAAVNKVDKPLEDGKRPLMVVADLVAKDLLALGIQRQTGLLKEAVLLVQLLNTPGLSDAAYRQRFADTQATMAALEALRVADPVGAANDFVKAHDELVAAVNNPKRNLEGLLTALGNFKDKVTALQAALAAASPKPVTAKKGG